MANLPAEMRFRLATGLAVALLAALAIVSTPRAHADGDPASDVLLGQNVFYPYQPATSKTLMASLNSATNAAAKRHFPLKVALIASPIDLGIIPQLLGKPQSYAKYLDYEISFNSKQPLLVVMKDGYGVEGLPASAAAAAAKLAAPAGGTPDDLAQAALSATGKLAAAAGDPIAGVKSTSSASGAGGGGGGGNAVLLIVLIVAALGTAGALIAVRRRPRAG
jgi:hypothetical protein